MASSWDFSDGVWAGNLLRFTDQDHVLKARRFQGSPFPYHWVVALDEHVDGR
jgi:hypothetical protein